MQRQTLSEISHLFLSEVRGRQSSSSPRQRRIPPKSGHAISAAADNEPSTRQVSAVLASHLGADYPRRLRDYARGLAAQAGRVGLIEISDAEFGLTCFESGGQTPGEAVILDLLDERQMTEALEELAFDVDRWLISAPQTHSPEARQLLQETPHWVLMCNADHDGVVSGYRALKGLCRGAAPNVSLLVLDSESGGDADAIFRKLDGASRQFLNCPMQPEPAPAVSAGVTEHLLLSCRGKAASPGAPWQVVSRFLEECSAPRTATTSHFSPSPGTPGEGRGGGDCPSASAPAADETPMEQPAMKLASAVEAPPAAAPQAPAVDRSPVPQGSGSSVAAVGLGLDEVVDLPAGDLSAAAVLAAIFNQAGASGQWIQCPIKPPACPAAVLAVGRDQRLALWAVAGKGLAELRQISQGYRWLQENRNLIQMALPQLAIDAHAMPMLRLIVDHADMTAESLQPLLQGGSVTVQAYRKLRWAGKTGLLLDAA